ncbi:MAG: LPS export ABC transporter permease LptG [Pseudomonadota bacterium]
MRLRRLDLYVLSHVLALTGLVALALLAVQSFLAFVAEIDSVGQGGFSYVTALAYTALMMPRGLYLMLPVIAMLGTLMGLGVLASQSELTAMRAAGISVMRIGGSTVLAGLVMALLCLLIGDWLAPEGQLRAEVLRNQAQYGSAAVAGERPLWLRQGADVIHIKQLRAEDHLGETEIFTLSSEQKLMAVSRIGEARFENGRWLLKDVQRTEFGAQSAQAQQRSEQSWEGQLAPEVLRLFVLETKALSMRGLRQLIAYMDDNRLDASIYRLAFWRKAVAPLTVIALMLFTVPFVFGPLRSAGAGQRLLIGILIGLSFYVVNDIVVNTTQLYGWTPWASAGSPTLALFAVALWRLRRVS